MEKSPLVSVIIATYNRPKLLARAIESVLAQSYRDFEIIVIDDGLTERADAVVENFTDKRVHYIQHTENKGCSAAKNTGIKVAKGDYVAILDDDDEWEKEKLAIQVAALTAANETVGFSFHAAVELFDDRQHVTTVPEGEADYLDFALRTFSGMIDSSMMYKKEVFATVGYLNEWYPTHTGAEFIIRVAQKFKGVGINKPLVRREMGSRHIQMGSRIERRIVGRLMLLDEYREEFQKRPRYLAKHLTQLGIFYRTNREYRKAMNAFSGALKKHFSFKRVFHILSMTLHGLPYRLYKGL